MAPVIFAGDSVAVVANHGAGQIKFAEPVLYNSTLHCRIPDQPPTHLFLRQMNFAAGDSKITEARLQLSPPVCVAGTAGMVVCSGKTGLEILTAPTALPLCSAQFAPV